VASMDPVPALVFLVGGAGVLLDAYLAERAAADESSYKQPAAP
jgi:hypothetical protein